MGDLLHIGFICQLRGDLECFFNLTPFRRAAGFPWTFMQGILRAADSDIWCYLYSLRRQAHGLNLNKYHTTQSRAVVSGE